MSKDLRGASDGIANLLAPQRDTALTVSEEDVRRAVFSFPAGSSGGPDGMRPQHLKDCCHVVILDLTFCLP